MATFNPTANVWNRRSANVVAAATTRLRLYHKTDTNYQISDVYQMRRVCAIDLTAAFGAGNEPTAAEMDTILASYAPTTLWLSGTAPLVINPAGQIFLPDSSGAGQHLKYRNVGYTAASGPQAGSPPFERMDGTDDYCRRTLATPIVNGSPVSISCWFRYSDLTVTCRMIRLADMAGHTFSVYTSGTSMVYTRLYSATDNQTAGVSCAGNNNLWMHVVGVYDPGTQKAKLYLNGAYGTITPAIAAPGLITVTDAVIANTDGLTGWTPGDITDLCIFGKVLTDADVKALYNYSCARFGKAAI